MAQRRHHYEVAFEHYLRAKRIPYVAVDEARKALIGSADIPLRLPVNAERSAAADEWDRLPTPRTLKSFDFVIYNDHARHDHTVAASAAESRAPNLLVEVKGRRVGGRLRAARPEAALVGVNGESPATGRNRRSTRLECWVTLEDVDGLRVWEKLFGPQFRAAFIFLYWCEEMPASALFEEVFEHRGRWYAVRSALLEDYVRVMRTRSRRWGTVHLAPDEFDRISRPLASRA